MRPAPRRATRRRSRAAWRSALRCRSSSSTSRVRPAYLLKVLLAMLVAALAAPVGALAGGPTLTVRDVPLHGGGRSLAAAAPRFNMVAVHWRGAGSVYFRTRAGRGPWSAWQKADDDV